MGGGGEEEGADMGSSRVQLLGNTLLGRSYRKPSSCGDPSQSMCSVLSRRLRKTCLLMVWECWQLLTCRLRCSSREEQKQWQCIIITVLAEFDGAAFVLVPIEAVSSSSSGSDAA
jgi:hypothetical protein